MYTCSSYAGPCRECEPIISSPLDENKARDILKKAPSVVVFDDRASNRFPTPLEFSLMYDVAVGRIRQDESQDGNHGLVNHEQTIGYIFIWVPNTQGCCS
ncbi:putative aspartate-semialdehyde dehydrogenase [Helianthus annuus]|nr:putative aspartate-semialdehyde dehydrogenase [Helianthus annuus]